jgi:hypothetical protein
MRFAIALMLIGLSLATSGCALLTDATRNTMLAIKQPFAEHQETARNRRWAEAAWRCVCADSPTRYSTDYADGFKRGYAEYLYRGGDGEPPLIPPLNYRNVKYQTPDGYAAIQDWFHGYRHGAAHARTSGARQWITGPSALPMESPAVRGGVHAATFPIGEPEILELPMPTPAPTPLPVPAPSPPPLNPSMLGNPEPTGRELPTNVEPVPALDAGPDLLMPPAISPVPTPTSIRLPITGIRAAPGPIRARITEISVAPPKN